MKHILITGSSGFIGQKIYFYLKQQNKYLIDCADINNIDNIYKSLKKYDIVIHMGAISETNSTDEKIIYNKNLKSSTDILNNIREDCKLIYASSAAVYGKYMDFPYEELPKYETGTSLYAKSKIIFDNIVRNFHKTRSIIGLRFFNVCSFKSEYNKKQPSPTFKFLHDLKSKNKITLFENSDKITRDFIYIDYILDIIDFFINLNIEKSDIVNIGSGVSFSFENLADCFLEKYRIGTIEYIKQPNSILSNYQLNTCANIEKLRSYGYDKNIQNILEVIKKYDN